MTNTFDFRADIPEQQVYFIAALPPDAMADVRNGQGLQVMDALTGRPALTPDGRRRVFPYQDVCRAVRGVEEAALRLEAESGDEDAAVLQVFLDFKKAVEAHFPEDIFEICSVKYQLEAAARASGLSVDNLKKRLRGDGKMQVHELYAIKVLFPNMDLLSSMRRLVENIGKR